MIPIKNVKNIINTYEALEKDLASHDIDKTEFVKKSKEYSSISEIIHEAKFYVNYAKEKEEIDKIINDKNNDIGMIDLAKKELSVLAEKKITYEKKLKMYLLPKDETDKKNAIVEIRAGTGGLEATLFVSDLFRMYEKVCLKKKWKMEIISLSKSDASGFKEAILLIKGNNAFSLLKYESGVHRVQ